MDILLKILILIIPLSVFITKIEMIYFMLFSILSVIYLIKNNNIKFLLLKTPLKFYFFFMIVSMISELILLLADKSVFTISISPYIRVFIYFVFMMLIINISKTKDIFDDVILYTIISSFIPNLIGILQYKYDMFTIVHSLEGQRRIGSTFVHPNFYAFYIVILIICLIYKIEKTKTFLKKILMFLYIGLNTILLIFTCARTPLIVLLVIILISLVRFVFFSGKNIYLKVFLNCFISVFLIVSAYSVLNSNMFLKSRFNIAATKNDDSFSWRLGKWESSLKYWSANIKNISIGCGWVTAREFTVDPAYKGYDMHNEFLRIIFDTGILGFITYMLFFVNIIRTVKKFNSDKVKRKFILNITMLLVIGASNDNILVVPENYIFIFVLLILTYSNTIYWSKRTEICHYLNKGVKK